MRDKSFSKELEILTYDQLKLAEAEPAEWNNSCDCEG